MEPIDWHDWERRRGEMDTRCYLRSYYRIADPTPTMHPGYLLWRMGDFVRALLFSEFFYPTLRIYRGCLFLEYLGLFKPEKVDRLLDEQGCEQAEVEEQLNTFELSVKFVSGTGWEQDRGRFANRLITKQAEAWRRWFRYRYPALDIDVKFLCESRSEPAPACGLTFRVDDREGLDAADDTSPDYRPVSLYRAVPEAYRDGEPELSSLLNVYLYQVGDLPQMALYSELHCPGSSVQQGKHPLRALYPAGRDVQERGAIDRAYREGPMAEANRHFSDEEGICVGTLFQSDIGDDYSIRGTLADRLEAGWSAWFESGHIERCGGEPDEHENDGAVGPRITVDSPSTNE